jgi:hypothetical protein
LKAGQVGICLEAFIATPRVGPGGIGHGDGRTFSGDDGSLSSRITVSAIISTDTEKIYTSKTEKISPSLVGNDNPDADPDVPFSSPVSLQGTATTDVTLSNINSKVGEKDFGAGVDVTISIANGTNGGQQLGKDLQATGAAVAGASSIDAGRIAGAVINGAGKVGEALAPAGTIDGNATLRITGNGQVTYVGGETRPFPSYAVYSYTVGADGKIITQEQRVRRETPPVENLTKPKIQW